MHMTNLDAGRKRLWIFCLFLGLSFSSIAEERISDLLDERTEIESQKSILIEREALGNSKRRALLAKRDKILEQADVLLVNMTAWHSKIQNLLKNTYGQAIASDDRLVEAFTALYEKKRMTHQDVVAIKIRVSDLLAPIELAQNQKSPYIPSDELFKELDREQQVITQAYDNYQKANDQLSSLVSKIDENHVSDSTLEVALANLRMKRADEMTQAEVSRQERLRAEIEKAKNDRAERLARLEIELLQKTTEQDEQLLRQQAAEGRLLRAEEAAYGTLRDRAESQAIQRKFAPFLTKGHQVLSNQGRWVSTQTPSPLSMTGLMQQHALSNPKRFVGVAITNHNDRPKWKKPKKNDDYGEYAALLEEFNQLAPVWVEMGLLNP